MRFREKNLLRRLRRRIVQRFKVTTLHICIDALPPWTNWLRCSKANGNTGPQLTATNSLQKQIK